MPKIIDVILHENCYGFTQVMVVVDEPIKHVYQKTGNYLLSCDDGFYDFLAIEPGSSDAFGGRKFDIQLSDGETYHCHGQVWSVGPPKDLEPTKQVGVATIEQLNKCYVFYGGNVGSAKLNDWLSNNKPSKNYYKYDKRETLEFQRSLTTQFGLCKPICSARSRKLRKRGVEIFRKDGKIFWSSSFERRKAEILARKAMDELP